MKDQTTRRYQDFEKSAASPDQLNEAELLAAFRAGNIAVAQAFLERKSHELPIRDWNAAIDILGDNLVRRYTSEDNND